MAKKIGIGEVICMMHKYSRKIECPWPIPDTEDTEITPVITVPTIIPDEYLVCVEIEGKQEWVLVDKDFFDSISKGKKLKVQYKISKLFGKLRIKEVFLITDDN